MVGLEIGVEETAETLQDGEKKVAQGKKKWIRCSSLPMTLTQKFQNQRDEVEVSVEVEPTRSGEAHRELLGNMEEGCSVAAARAAQPKIASTAR